MFESKEEKKVEYLELIYDLIFVYLIGRNSSLVQHVEGGFINWTLFVTYILCTLIAIQIWNFTTFYINRYGTNGIRDHISIFINMYLLYFMADATSAQWQEYFYRYNVAWCLILINIAVQYLFQLKNNNKAAPWEIAQIQWNFRIIITEAAIVLASIVIFALTGIVLSPAALLFGIIATIIAGRVNALVPVDFGHLSERAMLYVVFTFGEMIIAISSYFQGEFSFGLVYFSLLAFLIVVGLFLSYELFYDYLIDKEMSTNGTAYMMIHIFIIFALNNITMGLEFMHEGHIDAIPKTVYITSALVMFYVFLFLLGKFTGKQKRPPLSFISKVSLIGLSFIILMIVFMNNMYINIAISVVYVYIILAVLFDFRRKLNLCRD